jgi:hypothetical protein
MTRTTVLLLFVVTLSATPGPADDDPEVLWENPYDFPLMVTGFWCYGPYYTHDDFILETDSELQAVECWAFYSSMSDNPQPFNVALRYDHYGMPGSYYDNRHVTDVEETYTGDNFQGKPVFHYRLNWNDPMDVEGGETFWLEIWSYADYFKWGAEDGGLLYYLWNPVDCSAFFRLLGTPDDTGTETMSWGEIKAGYVD